VTEDEQDREVARILAMSDREVLEQAAAEGRDIELEVAQMQALFELAMMRHRRSYRA
jgi:hypothetical protein